MKAAHVLKPVETLNKDEKMLAQLTTQVEALEKQKAEADAANTKKSKGNGKAGTAAVKTPAATAPAPSAAKKP
ncbi:hypothetical protein EMGBD2_05490 [Nitrospirota bacterium]|nr:hypothetical protein EMGBD2_05490 [Nitrospirota bacterium]